MKTKIVFLVRYLCLGGIIAAGCLSIFGTGSSGGGGESHIDRLVGKWFMIQECTDDELIFSNDNTYSFEELDAELCPPEELELDSASGSWSLRDGLLYMTMTATTNEEEQDQIGQERCYEYCFIFSGGEKRLALFELEEDGFTPASAINGLVNTWTGRDEDGCEQTMAFNGDGTFSSVGFCPEEEDNWDIAGTYTFDDSWITATFTEMPLFDLEEDGFLPSLPINGPVNTWTGTDEDGCEQTLAFNGDGTFSSVGLCPGGEDNWDIAGTYTFDDSWITATFTEGENTQELRFFYRIIDSKLFFAKEEEVNTQEVRLFYKIIDSKLFFAEEEEELFTKIE